MPHTLVVPPLSIIGDISKSIYYINMDSYNDSYYSVGAVPYLYPLITISLTMIQVGWGAMATSAARAPSPMGLCVDLIRNVEEILLAT